MKIPIALPFVVAIASAPALAYDYTDRAEVISAIPVYETINEPQRECWTEFETRYERPARSNGGSIIGAVAGGLLGAQVGKGNGRVVAAAAGAAIGALVGERMDSDYRNAYPVERPVERCHATGAYRDQLTGYQVHYRYRGRDGMVLLPYDPGATVLIGVEVAGADRAPAAFVLPPTSAYRPVGINQVIHLEDARQYDRQRGKHKNKQKNKHRDRPHWY